MGIHKEMWLKDVVRMWSSYAILIGDRERQRGTYGRTNDLQVNINESLGEWMWYVSFMTIST